MPSLARRAPHALQSYRASSFSGGLDIQTSPQTMALNDARYGNRLTRATNITYALDGEASQRWGMRIVSSDAVFTGGVHGSITGGVQFVKAAGTIDNVVAMQDGTVYKFTSAGTATQIKSGLTAVDGPARFAQYNDLLVMVDGTNPAQKWDGTTWAALGGSAPAGSVVVTHADRMFMAKANSSTLYWSKINNILDWSGTTDAGSMDVGPSDGAGNLLNLVSSIQELVLLKAGRAYRLQGVGPATGYAIADHLVPSTSTVGTNSKRGAVFAENTVWYSSSVGMHQLSATQQFGDLQEEFATFNISPYFRTGTPYTLLSDPLTLASHPLATANLLYYAGSNAIVFGASTGSLGTNTLLIYDLALKAWSVWSPPGNMVITAMWPAINQTTGEHEIWLGIADTVLSTRAVYAMTRASVSDVDISQAAVPVTSRVTHGSALGGPGVAKVPRYAYLRFLRETSSSTITVNFYYDFLPTPVVTTTLDLSTGSVMGDTSTQGVWRVDLGGGVCEFLEVDIQHTTGLKKFEWQGYEILWRPRRLIQ